MIIHIFPQNGYGDIINILPLVFHLVDEGNICKLYVCHRMVDNLSRLILSNNIKFIGTDVVDNSKCTIIPNIKQFVRQIYYRNNIKRNKCLFFGKTDSYIKSLFNMETIPFCYYDQFAVQYKLPTSPYDIFWKQHRFNTTNQLQQPDIKYIFTHTSYSIGHTFKYDYTTTSALVIDPCTNTYPPTHPNYQLAQSFIGHHLYRYLELIINADEVHLSDSVFFCIAIHLPIITEKCYYYPRETQSSTDPLGTRYNYDYFWSTKFGYPTSTNCRKFTLKPPHIPSSHE